MNVLAAFLLAASPAPAASTLHAEQPMLDAFKAACRDPESFDGMKAAAVASGWEEVAEDVEPRLAALLQLGREAAQEEEPEGKNFGANYRRPYLNRHIYLVVSRHEAPEGYWGNGCRVFDFDAPAAPAPAALEAMVGKPPTGVQDLGEGMVKRLWEPGFQDGMSIEANYVPKGHSVAKTFGIEGVILIGQAIGGFESLFDAPAAEAASTDDTDTALPEGDNE